MFELELSWVTEDTKGKHEKVPADVQESAEKFAKESLEDDSDDSGDEMQKTLFDQQNLMFFVIVFLEKCFMKPLNFFEKK